MRDEKLRMSKVLILSSTFQKIKACFVGWFWLFFLTWVDACAKKVLDLIIDFYQNFISVILKNILGVNRMCKFSPTCSEYTKQMVQQHGFFGILLGAKRIGECK